MAPHGDLALGMDAGGSFTDSALVDLDRRIVIDKAKSPTTHGDLLLGMVDSISSLMVRGLEPEYVGLVGLSTTLATNSVLEGRGGRVGLIGIGWRPMRDWDLAADRSEFVRGGHDVKGNTVEPLDMDEVESAISSLEGHVDAVVVSGRFSIYDPSHERAVAAAVRRMTSLPVTAVHQIDSDLGVRERTVTACLNARLIPIIDRFLNDVGSMLSGLGFEADVMVLRSDGTLMNIDTARERPVDTILSGPAASVMGAHFLGGRGDCIVVDVGSTSTDMSIVRDGRPPLISSGARVGDWVTRVRTVDVTTVGLGGDSVVVPHPNGKVDIGPERALPLCRAATDHPSIAERVSRLGEVRFLVAMERRHEPDGRPGMVWDLLHATGPMTIREIMAMFPGMYLVENYVDSLVRDGYAAWTGLTPTDVMHCTRSYVRWDTAAADAGVNAMAARSAHSPEGLCERVMQAMVSSVAKEVVAMAIEREMGTDAHGMASVLVCEPPLSTLDIDIRTRLPIVGLGASARSLLPSLVDRIGGYVVVPRDADVGNAVGAVCGTVSESSTVEVRQIDDGGFLLTSSFAGTETVPGLGEALLKARSMASDHARSMALRTGALDPVVKVDEDRTNFYDKLTNTSSISWIRVSARATGGARRLRSGR